jgi:predicted transglutaminase-like cysteine proteinase
MISAILRHSVMCHARRLAIVAGALAAMLPINHALASSRSALPGSGHVIAGAEQVLAPFAHVRFCAQHREQCQVKRSSIRKSKMRMTPERFAMLERVNLSVNNAIIPQADPPGLLGDTWTLSPARGDCDDYAVSKRAQLLAKGWSSRSLLLVSATLPDRQEHLVLVVRTSAGDVVLDNLRRDVRPVSAVRYHWRSIQDEGHPAFWRRVDARTMLIAVAPPISEEQIRTVQMAGRYSLADAGVSLRGTITR